MFTLRRLRPLLAAALTLCLCAFPVAVFAAPIVCSNTASAQLRKDTAPMKVKNESARLVHLQLRYGDIRSIAPLKEIELAGEDAAIAKLLLEGPEAPLAGLVKSGELVVDGKPVAPPPSIEPSQPPTGAPPMPNTASQTADGAPATDASERDTDPIPSAMAAPPPAAAQPGSSKRR